MNEKQGNLKVSNFHCSEHGYITPEPICPKCKQSPIPTPQGTKGWIVHEIHGKSGKTTDGEDLYWAKVREGVDNRLSQQAQEFEEMIEGMIEKRLPLEGSDEVFWKISGYNQALDSLLSKLKQKNIQ